MSPLSRTSIATLRRNGVMVPRPSQVRFAQQQHHSHLPFKYDPNHKAAFRAKYLAFVGLGFALPFVATGWQLYKSGGGASA